MQTSPNGRGRDLRKRKDGEENKHKTDPQEKLKAGQTEINK